MPNFKRKAEGKSRGKWSGIDMKKAVPSVLENIMSEKATANHFNGPRTPLNRRIKSIIGAQQTEIKSTFTTHYKHMLIVHVRDLDLRLMPLAKTDFLKLAYAVLDSLKLSYRFNRAQKMAAKDFYLSFMKRHSDFGFLEYSTPVCMKITR